MLDENITLDAATLLREAGHAGIWVLRPATQSVENTLNAVRSALALLESEPTERRLWLVEPGRIRIRE